MFIDIEAVDAAPVPLQTSVAGLVIVGVNSAGRMIANISVGLIEPNSIGSSHTGNIITGELFEEGYSQKVIPLSYVNSLGQRIMVVSPENESGENILTVLIYDEDGNVLSSVQLPIMVTSGVTAPAEVPNTLSGISIDSIVILMIVAGFSAMMIQQMKEFFGYGPELY